MIIIAISFAWRCTKWVRAELLVPTMFCAWIRMSVGPISLTNVTPSRLIKPLTNILNHAFAWHHEYNVFLFILHV